MDTKVWLYKVMVVFGELTDKNEMALEHVLKTKNSKDQIIFSDRKVAKELVISSSSIRTLRNDLTRKGFLKKVKKDLYVLQIPGE